MRITSDGALAFGGAAYYGTSGQVLTSAGSSAVPTWEDAGGGGGGNLTTKGDLEVYTTSQTRLAVGDDDKVLTADSSAASGVAWKDASAASNYWIESGTYLYRDSKVGIGTGNVVNTGGECLTLAASSTTTTLADMDGPDLTIRNYDDTTGNYGSVRFMSYASTAINSAIVGITTNHDEGYGELAFMTRTGTPGGSSTFSEQMRIDEDGKVGIGTDDPSRNLSVYGASQANIALFTSSTGTTTSDGLQLITDGNAAYLEFRENGPMHFSTNSASPSITILSSGDVGIGTAAPKTKLTVEGSVTLKEQADAEADTAGYGQLWVNTATPNELWFTDDAGTDDRLGTAMSVTTVTSGGATAYTLTENGQDQLYIVDDSTSRGANTTFTIPAAGTVPAGRQISIFALDLQLSSDGNAAVIKSTSASDKLITSASLQAGYSPTDELIDDSGGMEGAIPITLVSDGSSRWVSTQTADATSGAYWYNQ